MDLYTTSLDFDMCLDLYPKCIDKNCMPNAWLE